VFATGMHHNPHTSSLITAVSILYIFTLDQEIPLALSISKHSDSKKEASLLKI